MKKIQIVTVCDNIGCNGELRDGDYRYTILSPYDINEPLEFCCGRCLKDFMANVIEENTMVSDMFKGKGFEVIYHED